MKLEKCTCHNPPLHHTDFKRIRFVGIDETKGRYGRVTIEKCKHCNSLWLKYFVEYESFSKSGRWFRGQIDKENSKKITPENSVEYLRSLAWYLYGGSYFDHNGRKGSENIRVDP